MKDLGSLFTMPRPFHKTNRFLYLNRPFPHSCKQRHQFEARVDKIQWFVWNCPPEPRLHFFMFAHWSVMRERSIRRKSIIFVLHVCVLTSSSYYRIVSNPFPCLSVSNGMAFLGMLHPNDIKVVFTLKTTLRILELFLGLSPILRDSCERQANPDSPSC